MSIAGISAVGGAIVGTILLSIKSKRDKNRGPWNPSIDPSVQYDYVILGGGTAGCVLASRLTEDPKVNVLILEAGHSDDIKESMTPAMFGELLGPNTNWGFTSVPQKHANGRKVDQPRGKLLGGSSAINVMFYQRGPASDYDEWGTLGNPG
ncbi:hypothetical protein BGZ76_004101, partial [Entomortierella beljakovae]